MRRILVILAVLCAFSCFGEKDVTKFLGFPVDGSKSEMIRNLKSKGFKKANYNGNDYLTGRFNGSPVQVYIPTEKGRVWRIMVSDENTVSEADIKIRFNQLCNQFRESGKYLVFDDFTIPESEDISYEMTVHKKRYEAVFYQLPEGSTKEQIMSSIFDDIQNKYRQKNLDSLTDEIREELLTTCASTLIDTVKNKPVWFVILEVYGKYRIAMFYDNEYNRANGEDL